jgi:hypothetical protein
MSIENTKNNLKQLIEDPSNRVIALSGKWGTGKSYLWRSVQTDPDAASAKDALYASLFGIKDISQLKLKLAQAAIAKQDDGRAKQLMAEAWKHGSKVLKVFKPNAAASIDEVALMAVPKLLSERFIVIDDIERKHEKLDITEVMGFIDEYTQIHETRFLLILNSNQLTDQKIWETLREKVIDHEVALSTTSEEAVEIALKAVPTQYAAMIQSAVKICGITNIRIIQKIIRVVNRLLEGRMGLTEDVQQRVIPSTVLLGGIYYKGIENGPDADFVLKFNSTLYYLEKHQREREQVVDAERDKDMAQWASMLSDLGIRGSDEYEVLVLDFLKTGLLDVAAADSIFKRYLSERDLFLASSRYQELSDKTLWNPELSNEELLAEAEGMLPVVHLLDAYSVTSLHWVISKIPGGDDYANRLVEQWLKKYREGEPHGFDVDRVIQRDIHPDIEAEFEHNRTQLQPLPSLLEVCQNIGKNQGWGKLEELAMQASTPKQYEEEIRRLSGKELRTLMLKNVEFYKNLPAYEGHFGQAMNNFVSACRSICQQNDNERRSDLIRQLFKSKGMEALLGPGPAAVENAI